MNLFKILKKFIILKGVNIFSRVLSREDVRFLLVKQLPYLEDILSGIALDTTKNLQNPYNNLKKQHLQREHISERNDIVFITGRFRSGSTLLWNIFRDIPGYVSYYEPFNERRWFDESFRGSDTDSSHLGVHDYWKEYQGLDVLVKYFDESWNDSRLFMSDKSYDDRMLKYIDEIILSTKGRPVLQFNRIDFRLSWIKKNYPAAKIVHIYRNPRDQWMSIIKATNLCPPDVRFSELGDKDFFYLRKWGRDLCTIYPFLHEPQLNHPYELFYLLWRLSYNHGKEFANVSIGLEELVSDTRDSLKSLFTSLNVEHSCINQASEKVKAIESNKWKKYAPESWFSQREYFCEDLLDRYYKIKSIDHTK